MGLPENLSTTTFVLTALTWKRLFRLFLVIAFLMTVVLASMNFSWFSKTPVLKEDENVKLLVVSRSAAKKMADANKKYDVIVGIQVVTLNFHKNIRIETYMDIDNGVIQDAYNTYVNNKLYETPIFTTDKVNNNRILHIINGEFICVPYKESTAYKYAPALDQAFITDVCAVGIPPYNNDVSGILTFYLKNPPTADEKATIFLFARDISTQIFAESTK